MADQVERSQLAAKPPTVSRSSAIMAFTACFAAGYLLAGSSSETGGVLTEPARAAEPDEIGAAEERQTPSQPFDRYHLHRACRGGSAKRSADQFLCPADLAREPVRSVGCKPSRGAGRGAVYACYRELARSFQSL